MKLNLQNLFLGLLLFFFLLLGLVAVLGGNENRPDEPYGYNRMPSPTATPVGVLPTATPYSVEPKQKRNQDVIVLPTSIVYGTPTIGGRPGIEVPGDTSGQIVYTPVPTLVVVPDPNRPHTQ